MDVKTKGESIQLTAGSRIGVIGAGPAGTFTAYFLLEMAERIGLDLQVDIYDPKDFTCHGPKGCNFCGGIVSESLVQALAAEGIALPTRVVQRGIDSYVLHVGDDAVRIATPLHEMRLAALHRGKGPAGCQRLDVDWDSFDGFLLDLAIGKGATHHAAAVDAIAWQDGRPSLCIGDEQREYDLVIGAIGVNAKAGELFAGSGLATRQPATATTAISELFIGQELVERHFGSSMHVFMLDMPGIEFAALIPKGEYLTACLLGDGVGRGSMNDFLQLPMVRDCLPIDWSQPPLSCRCQPAINVGPAAPLSRDRLVLVGDCGVSRLYKDGIGAAYRSAKAVAVTAIFHGVSAADFAGWYEPVCRRMASDNRLGTWLFRCAGMLRDWKPLRRAMLGLARREQQAAPPTEAAMSRILWDLFTGSATYRDILGRALSPRFLWRFATQMFRPLPAEKQP